MSSRSWLVPPLLLCVFVLVPLAVVLEVALGIRHPYAVRERIVAGAVLSAMVLNQLPRVVGAAAVAAGLVVFALLPAPPPGSTSSQHSLLMAARTAAVSSFVLVGVLLTENFFVWVVSATYTESHRAPYPPPLRDNGRKILEWLFFSDSDGGGGASGTVSRQTLQTLRDSLAMPWALVAATVGALACADRGLAAGERTLYGVATRATTTLALARCVRTVSFLMTVLPSQVARCYPRHYPVPPPPAFSVDWFRVGLLPTSHGGCNDLIISGHATVTSVLLCTGADVAGNRRLTVALWMLMAVDYAIEVAQGYHYSVDMWLGAVVTVLIFRANMPLSSSSFRERDRGDVDQDDTDNDSHSKDKDHPRRPLSGGSTSTLLGLFPRQPLSTNKLLLYASPAALAFAIVVQIFPRSTANYFLLAYLVGAIYVHRIGNVDYAKHLLLCMLYVALGVYL